MKAEKNEAEGLGKKKPQTSSETGASVAAAAAFLFRVLGFLTLRFYSTMQRPVYTVKMEKPLLCFSLLRPLK